MEELISEFLKDWEFKVLPKIIIADPTNPRKKLDIDQCFTDCKIYYFIKQKVRDGHDSTKKRVRYRSPKFRKAKLHTIWRYLP